MNDRFKFRARIYSTINKDEENEKEISFYIYDIAIYQYGEIGFSHNQLINALNNLKLTDKQKDEIIETISANSYCEDYDWYTIEFGQIEQWTGLYDINEAPIYENDIIKVEGNYCPIIWDKENARYDVVGYGEIAYLNYNEIKVISNIHENKGVIG